MRHYLDSSVIVKRYLREPGSEYVDKIYQGAENGEELLFSIWNVGEVLGVLDRYMRNRIIDEAGFKVALRNFLLETLKLMELGRLNVLPVTAGSLLNSWMIVLEDHIYMADALQISSALETEAEELITADKLLGNIARKRGLKAIVMEE
ncbi:MAG: type II toxin-antitoxin system VapC family toxin [Thermoproteota archaeon]